MRTVDPTFGRLLQTRTFRSTDNSVGDELLFFTQSAVPHSRWPRVARVCRRLQCWCGPASRPTHETLRKKGLMQSISDSEHSAVTVAAANRVLSLQTWSTAPIADSVLRWGALSVATELSKHSHHLVETQNSNILFVDGTERSCDGGVLPLCYRVCPTAPSGGIGRTLGTRQEDQAVVSSPYACVSPSLLGCNRGYKLWRSDLDSA